jgi:hypothetical protein
MLSRQPIHIALAISLSLHMGIALNLFFSIAPAKHPASLTDQLPVFKTYLTSHIVTNAPQLPLKKNNEVGSSLVPPQDKEQSQTDTTPSTDHVEYRRSYSMFGRPRHSGPSQSNSEIAFQQRYFAFQRRLEFVASSPGLQGECTVISSADWREFMVNCNESQDVNLIRSELSSVAYLRDTISGLKHCLALRKNELLKKENCAPLQ